MAIEIKEYEGYEPVPVNNTSKKPDDKKSPKTTTLQKPTK
jgi:hypothetical protein